MCYSSGGNPFLGISFDFLSLTYVLRGIFAYKSATTAFQRVFTEHTGPPRAHNAYLRKEEAKADFLAAFSCPETLSVPRTRPLKCPTVALHPGVSVTTGPV